MKAFIILTIVTVCASAKLRTGPLFDLGSYSHEVTQGQKLPEKYNPMDVRDLSATKSIRAALDKYIHSKDVLPQIDPYVNEKIGPIYVSNIVSDLVLTKFKAVGASKASVNYFEIRLNKQSFKTADPFRADFDLSLSELELNTDLSTDVVGVMQLDGHIHMILSGIHVESGSALAAQGSAYQIAGTKTKINVDKIQIQVTLPKYPDMETDENLIKYAYDTVKDDVAAAIVDYATKQLNEKLKTVTAQEIVDLINSN